MGAALMILAGILFLIAVIWAERSSAAAIEKERHELQEQIKGLPLDTQVQLWSAQIRDEARRDLY